MNNLVVALAKAGRGPEAVRRAEAWVAAKPADPERLFTLGLAQSEQDVDAATRTMRQVIAVRPDHALAHYNLALLLKRLDRVDEAIAQARRAAAIDGRPEAHVALGSLYTQQADFAQAAVSLEAAIAADRRAVDAWVLLARYGRRAAICAAPPTPCATRLPSDPSRGRRMRPWPPSSRWPATPTPAAAPPSKPSGAASTINASAPPSS